MLNIVQYNHIRFFSENICLSDRNLINVHRRISKSLITSFQFTSWSCEGQQVASNEKRKNKRSSSSFVIPLVSHTFRLVRKRTWTNLSKFEDKARDRCWRQSFLFLPKTDVRHLTKLREQAMSHRQQTIWKLREKTGTFHWSIVRLLLYFEREFTIIFRRIHFI